MKSKRKILAILASSFALLLTACDLTLANLTSKSVPENPSGIYTLSMEARIKNAMVDSDSIKARIVIDGREHEMVRSDVGRNIFDYDYKLPEGRDNAKYYYLVDYRLKTPDSKIRNMKSSVERFNISNRYPVMLESNRAPIGSRIPLLGRGFTRYDKVILGSIEVDTKFVSENQLVFTVPPLPAGRTYSVELAGAGGNQFIDNFRIDKSTINVVPAAIKLDSGQVQRLLFKVDFEAPVGGLRVEVTTDIPAGVIMEEVIIPEGASTISIPVKGGVPSRGNLYVNVPGFDEVIVPVEVTP
jgi:hypothetical protein